MFGVNERTTNEGQKQTFRSQNFKKKSVKLPIILFYFFTEEAL